ncbi:MAG: hypothetical protein K0S82_60 [Gaiellaceae bacterium]|nr:hypothetical protein [Gaiellaceae bacterium]
MTVVIDIGCARYGGDYSIERLLEEFKPVTMLYGFDPNGEIVASAPEGASRISPTRWQMPDGAGVALEQKAAWTYDGEIGYLSDGLNSCLTERNDVTQVECFDLARFIVERSQRADQAGGLDIVLKMDAEGSEYDLLDHLIAAGGDALLKLAWVEWHPKRIVNAAQRRKNIEDRIACELAEWRW